jgi:hypothetical protein
MAIKSNVFNVRAAGSPAEENKAVSPSSWILPATADRIRRRTAVHEAAGRMGGVVLPVPRFPYGACVWHTT